jgi:hypothetical protein
VVRSKPSSPLICFHGTRAARDQTSLRSAASIQSTQSKVCSSRVIAAANGRDHERQGSRRMKQSRAMSLVEAVANVIMGYGVAVVTQIRIIPIFGLHTTLAQNLKMGAVFTVVRIARSFALRRVFEANHVRLSTSRHVASQAPGETRVRLAISDAVQCASASRFTGSANGALGSQT